MARYRLIMSLSWTLVAAMALSPAASRAGSLLSGYGGPGEGNQAILGSALLNGPSGGGGAGGGSGGSGPTTGASAPTSGAVQPVAGSVRSGRSARSPRQLERTAGKAPRGGASADRATDLTASRERAGSSSAPVLTGVDLAYVILALGALVLTGWLTRQMTRHPAGGRG
jgi:cobalamin biosynthesis Mg chelatase CobN